MTYIPTLIFILEVLRVPILLTVALIIVVEIQTNIRSFHENFYWVISFLFFIGMSLNICIIIYKMSIRGLDILSILDILTFITRTYFIYRFINWCKTKKTYFSSLLLVLWCLLYVSFCVKGFYWLGHTPVETLDIIRNNFARMCIMPLTPWMETVRGLDFNNREEFDAHFRPIIAGLRIESARLLGLANRLHILETRGSDFYSSKESLVSTFIQGRRDFTLDKVMSDIQNSSVRGNRDFSKSIILGLMRYPSDKIQEATSIVRNLGYNW